MYQAPRGTQDKLPEDQAYWKYVEDTAAEVAALYYYSRLDTPVFEDSGLFIRGVGEGTDIVEKEMYTFNDLGGSSVTLRPEGTAPVCRAYVEHGMSNLPQPVKLYYIMSIFRYERPQAGRMRQFHQFGFEALGESSALLDAEVIDMSCCFYKKLGLKDLTLLVNNIGCPECRPAYLKTLRDYYRDHLGEMCEDCKNRFEKNVLRLLDCKKPNCKVLADNAPKSIEHLCDECSAHFAALTKRLDQLKLDYVIDHRLVRGLDYYTKTVFEIQPLIEGAQSTIGGGGRYDKLIEELGGKPTEGVGFATGLERVILNLKRAGIEPPKSDKPDVFVIWCGENTLDMAGHITSALRENGVPVATVYSPRSMKAQMRQANTFGSRYVIIIGESEAENKNYTFKDMQNNTQETLTEEELLKRLS
jgi:histidyl-tRNA synthetase